MKWYSTYKHPDNMFFIIEYDEGYGAYLYAYYEEFSFFEEDVKSPDGCPNHQYDDHQDNLQSAQSVADFDFGVPVDSWVEVKP